MDLSYNAEYERFRTEVRAFLDEHWTEADRASTPPPDGQASLLGSVVRTDERATQFRLEAIARASRVSMARKRRREHRIGTGPDCWVACVIWIWPPVFRHCVGGGSLATFRFAAVAHYASSLPSPRSRMLLANGRASPKTADFL
jgi:hypothetical protein